MTTIGSASEFDTWVQELQAARPHGADDELGSLNHLDEAARGRGRDAIRTGAAVGLAADLQAGPTVRHDGSSAFELEVFATSSASGFPMPAGFGIQSDRVVLDCHGLVNTHIDALNHMGFFGVWFDGSPNSSVTAAGSVHGLARFGIFTRAVYVDVSSIWDRPITGDDIDVALGAAGLTFETGDALLLDCGRDRFEAEHGPWPGASPRPGSGPGVAVWLAEHHPSVLCWDMLDGDNDLGVIGPVHHLNWAIGLIIVDNCDYSRARAHFANRNPATAALAVAPLPIAGATGSNVNPLLIL